MFDGVVVIEHPAQHSLVPATKPILKIEKDTGSEEMPVTGAHPTNGIDKDGAVSHARNQASSIA
jgi:hypothetical protein